MQVICSIRYNTTRDVRIPDTMEDIHLKPFLTALLLLFAYTMCAAAADITLYKSSFADDDRTLWTGWSEKPWTIEYLPNGGEGSPALKYTVSDGWNVPILNFAKPVPISENTIVRFKLKCNSGRYGLNIHDKQEGSEYFLSFLVPASNQWVTIQKYLKKAVYKRYGKDDIPKDGLAGDDLESIHIATSGPEVCVSDFEIVNVAEPIKELPAEESFYDGIYKPLKQEITDKVFPYGFIYQGIAEIINAQIFGQTTEERYDESVRDMKRHYMNTYCNFCDDANVDYRLSLSSKYSMYLIETLFCGAQFYHQTDTTNETAIVKKASQDNWLLAWYGPDEPSDYKAWLGNKLGINKVDSKHPVVSAFCTPDAVANLGPYCETTMIDIYSTRKNSFEAGPILNHADAIRAARKYTAGKKVWFIPQSYGDRGAQRYPTPAEIRLETFNSIAAGVNGLVFFIYNDSCSYLAPKVAEGNSEKFDDTPIDPWFNDNPTYREMARIGKDVIPIMPSIMDSVETTTDADRIHYSKAGLVYSSSKTRFGTVYVVANKSLQEKYVGTINPKVAAGQHLYNLITLKPLLLDKQSKLAIVLSPGDGAIYLAADVKSWTEIRSQIVKRKNDTEYQLLQQDSVSLKEAKIDTGSLDECINSAKKAISAGRVVNAGIFIALANQQKAMTIAGNKAYSSQAKILDQIKSDFGSIHTTLKTKTEIYAGSEDPAWVTRYNKMRDYSKEYYKLKSNWKTGNFSNTAQLTQLQYNVKALKADIQASI
jgi:hypothetical protein